MKKGKSTVRSKDQIQEDYMGLAKEVRDKILAMSNKKAQLPHKILSERKFNAYTFKAMEAMGMIKKVDDYNKLYCWIYSLDSDELDLELGEAVWKKARQLEEAGRTTPKHPKPERSDSKVLSGDPEMHAIMKKVNTTVRPKHIVSKTDADLIRIANASKPKTSKGVIFTMLQLLFIEKMNINTPVLINGVKISNAKAIEFIEGKDSSYYIIRIGDAEVSTSSDLLIDKTSDSVIEMVTL